MASEPKHDGNDNARWDKPKEWWINPGPNQSGAIAGPGETRLWGGIHVIEKAAYDALKAELAAAQATGLLWLKRNEQLETENKDLKEGADEHRFYCTQRDGQLTKAQARVQGLVGALELISNYSGRDTDFPANCAHEALTKYHGS